MTFSSSSVFIFCIMLLLFILYSTFFPFLSFLKIIKLYTLLQLLTFSRGNLRSIYFNQYSRLLPFKKMCYMHHGVTSVGIMFASSNKQKKDALLGMQHYLCVWSKDKECWREKMRESEIEYVSGWVTSGGLWQWCSEADCTTIVPRKIQWMCNGKRLQVKTQHVHIMSTDMLLE